MKSLLSFGEQVKTEEAQLIILCSGSNTITAKKDSTTKTAYGSKNTFYFAGLTVGDWTITASNGTYTTSKTVSVTANTLNEVIQISYNMIPEFTYTGNYEILNDDNIGITHSNGNWKIRFLTSGTLNFTSLNGATNGIDVFLVGGGGGGNIRGGGGGGYTTTSKNLKIATNVNYSIVIGSGGNVRSTGGNSSIFDKSAAGGKSGNNPAGAGGSGGGGRSDNGGNGGDGGSDGSNGKDSYGKGGTGQGITTREFGESTGRLYAGGGGGGASGSGNGGAGGEGGGGHGGGEDPYENTSVETTSTSGKPNTGGGGGAGLTERAGGSGIVVIRNARS